MNIMNKAGHMITDTKKKNVILGEKEIHTILYNTFNSEIQRGVFFERYKLLKLTLKEIKYLNKLCIK